MGSQLENAPLHPDVNVRCAPASRQESGSVYTSVFPVRQTEPEINSFRHDFDLQTLRESREASRPAAPYAPHFRPQLPSRSHKPYKTGSETVSRYHCLCQESQTLLTSSLSFFQKKKVLSNH